MPLAPSPINKNHHFDGWDSKQKIDGLWHCYTHMISLFLILFFVFVCRNRNKDFKWFQSLESILHAGGCMAMLCVACSFTSVRSSGLTKSSPLTLAAVEGYKHYMTSACWILDDSMSTNVKTLSTHVKVHPKIPSLLDSYSIPQIIRLVLVSESLQFTGSFKNGVNM